ncbi:MAG TPA: twin-arginine translocation signal domain-containing protein [Gemmatimonadales bacterium]|jgi:protocatechuate 3,4-dioxygenase beta subunit|nr:twin-arginine translocation signal domain-containing protein [Gemmatimonadales bacterium]
MRPTRRSLLKFLIAAGSAAGALGAAGIYWFRRWLNPMTRLDYPFPEPPMRPPLALTPACDAAARSLTAESLEGPFYIPKTPQRTVLREPDTIGRPLLITGRVMYPDCRPIAGAVLDFWSCDGAGVYDNDGYRLRGHQFTDAAGKFQVELVKPKDYALLWFRRTAHVHVKVQGRDTPLLTTQLFFPGEPLNSQDPYLDERLLLALAERPDGSLLGRFDFVLARTGPAWPSA